MADDVSLGLIPAVAVIGAGPIGLMAANLLGTMGIDVTIFERSPDLLGLPRAIAYDPETLRLFDQIGLLEKLSAGLVPDPRVVYVNGRGRQLMEMVVPPSPIGYSRIGTFYQPALERVLLDGLRRFANVQICFATDVTGLVQDKDGVDLKVSRADGKFCPRFDYVIACDGGASPTRTAIGSTFTGSTFSERWLVIDTVIPGHDIKEITFFCDPNRPAVRLPSVGDRVRFEFMQMPGETSEELAADAMVEKLLTPLVDTKRVQIERKTVYTFHARVADHWRKERVFLAGDAAHVMPPFAGQGMNSGMRDVANLCWKIVAVLRGQASPAILETYKAERGPPLNEMITLAQRLGGVIMPTSHRMARVRDAAFWCVNRFAGIKRFIRNGGLLPPPTIGRSALIGRRRDKLAGVMLPQPITAFGGERARLDHWIGSGRWCVLGFGVDPITRLAAGDLAKLYALDAAFLRIDPPETASSNALVVEDRSFLDWARKTRLGTVLVRPDRYIAESARASRELATLAPFNSKASSSVTKYPLVAGMNGMKAPSTRIVADKLQHHVFYVSDLEKSKAFYESLFNLQFSALNHPDSSAAMRLANMEMRFFSFGYYHHDLCLVKHRSLKMDNGSMLHFAVRARDREHFRDIRARAGTMGVDAREGRVIASAKSSPGQSAFWFRDPDGHCIEVLEGQPS